MSDWCILRTAGRSTLPLAASLSEDGFDAWAPARNAKIRKPRWNVHREVTLPVMAGFVFAKAYHLYDLLEISEGSYRLRRGPGRQSPAHPDFSVFRHFDRIPLICDEDLEPLRAHERAAPTAAELKDIFRRGEKVTVTDGIFGGMGGIVERSDGTHTLVRFGSRMRVKINTFILQPTCAIRPLIAAKAA